jgi:hypothetical protein
MAYLDLTPMLQAMRARPSEFDMQASYLRHIPSQHLLTFNIWGNAVVHAGCDCAMLQVSREQSDEMKAALSAWKVVYWEPRLAEIAAEKRAVQINREFALHFRPPGLWRRFFARLRRSDAPFQWVVDDRSDENFTAEMHGSRLSGKAASALRREPMHN